MSDKMDRNTPPDPGDIPGLRRGLLYHVVLMEEGDWFVARYEGGDSWTQGAHRDDRFFCGADKIGRGQVCRLVIADAAPSRRRSLASQPGGAERLAAIERRLSELERRQSPYAGTRA